MQYLMIRNPGVADPRAFTVLGVSATRARGKAGTIGQFGSGSKFSIALLLRNGISPFIFCGGLRMEFFTRTETVDGMDYDRVCVKYGGKDAFGVSRSGTEDLGFTLQWGVQDWNNIAMALREFVANSIDGAICSTDGICNTNFRDLVELAIVEHPRAKAGHTTVFIPYNPIVSAYELIDTMFLHFSRPDCLDEKCLPKCREDNKTRIYKKGVLACEINTPSVFDYNLGGELSLDESRNADDWSVRYAVSYALQENASAEVLSQIMREVRRNPDLFEAKLNHVGGIVKPKRADTLRSAWTIVAGPEGIVTGGSGPLDDLIQRKGYNPVPMPRYWHEVLRESGVPGENAVLTANEAAGKIVGEPTSDMIRMVDKVWEMVSKYNQTGNKEKPGVKSFHSVMDGGTITLGYYLAGGQNIYLDDTLGWGKMLFKVTLEEVIHYVTKSADLSRDLQNFLFDLVTQMVWEE